MLLPLLLALSALAGTIRVNSQTPVVVEIDGARVPAIPGTANAAKHGLDPGTHTVVVKNLMLRPMTETQVTLAPHEKVVLKYRRKSLEEVSRTVVQQQPEPDQVEVSLDASAPPPTPPEVQTGTSVSISIDASGQPPAPQPSSSFGNAVHTPPPAASHVASVSWLGLDPSSSAIYLDGRAVPYYADLGAFVAIDLVPGRVYAYRLDFMGSTLMTADYHGEAGTHEACMVTMTPYDVDHICEVKPGAMSAAEVGAAGQVHSTTHVHTSTVTTAPPPPPPPQPMAPGDLAALVDAVDDAAFSDDKLNLIRSAAPHNWFTCDQVIAILEEIAHSSDKLDAVRILEPRVIDRQNAWKVQEAFTFSSDKEKVGTMFR